MSITSNATPQPIMEPKLADLPTWLREVKMNVTALRGDIYRVVETLDGPRDTAEAQATDRTPTGLREEIFDELKDIKSVIFQAQDCVKEVLRELNIEEKTKSAELARTA